MANLIFTNYAYAAAGGTANRTSPARASDVINVKEFGATGDGTTNDTAAFTAWINYLQAVTAQPLTGFIPAGRYLITAPLPRITHPIGIHGAGVYRTWIVLGTAMAGDLFSFSECWRGVGGSWPNLGPTTITATSTTGVSIRDFTVLGSRSAAAGTQNAFVFYDRNDDVWMNNINCFYINGRAIYVGDVSAQTQGYMRESCFSHLKLFWCGASNTIPVVEFTSQATSAGSDGTNEIVVNDCQIYSPYGPGFWIRNEGPTSGSTRNFHIDRLRVEGNSATPAVATSDLIKIGDTTSPLAVKAISIEQMSVLLSYPAGAGVRISGASAAAVPQKIYIEGTITVGGSPSGVGLSIDGGTSIFCDLQSLAASSNTALVVGPSTLVTGPIYLNGYGQETGWSTNIDASAKFHVIKPSTIAWP